MFIVPLAFRDGAHRRHRNTDWHQGRSRERRAAVISKAKTVLGSALDISEVESAVIAPRSQGVVRICVGLGALALAAAVYVLLGSSSTPTAVADPGCSNGALRDAQGSTYLADCRAYEQVTPPDKNFTPASAGTAGVIALAAASDTGDAASICTVAQFNDAPAGTCASYTFMRTSNAWETHNWEPPFCNVDFSQPLDFSFIFLAHSVTASRDMSGSLIFHPENAPDPDNCSLG